MNAPLIKSIPLIQWLLENAANDDFPEWPQTETIGEVFPALLMPPESHYA
jgi:hypothetical protein